MIHGGSVLNLMCKCHMAPDLTLRILEGIPYRASPL